nr:TPA_asm: hypothetical protein [Fasciohepa virus 2]
MPIMCLSAFLIVFLFSIGSSKSRWIPGFYQTDNPFPPAPSIPKSYRPRINNTIFLPGDYSHVTLFSRNDSDVVCELELRVWFTSECSHIRGIDVNFCVDWVITLIRPIINKHPCDYFKSWAFHDSVWDPIHTSLLFRVNLYPRLLERMRQIDDDDPIIAGHCVLPKERCVSILNKFWIEERVCPRLLGCDVPQFYDLARYWFSQTFACIPFKREVDSVIAIKPLSELLQLTTEVWNPFRGDIQLAHDIRNDRYAIIPSRCAQDLIVRKNFEFQWHRPVVTSSDAEAVFLKYNLDVVTTHCIEPLWHDEATTAKALIRQGFYRTYRSEWERVRINPVQVIDNYLISNCTVEKFLGAKVCIVAHADVSFLRYNITRRYLIQYSSHNWFTALFMTIVHAILDPLIDLLLELLRYVLILLFRTLAYLASISVGGVSIFVFVLISTVISCTIYIRYQSWTLALIIPILIFAIFVQSN